MPRSLVAYSNYRIVFDLSACRAEIAALERSLSRSDTWADPLKAARLSRRLSELRTIVGTIDEVSEQLTFLQELVSSVGATDPEIARVFRQASKALDRLEEEVFLSGPYDDHPAVVSIHAGTGGTEAQAWAEMLARMYSEWAKMEGYACEIEDLALGEIAGIKSATFVITGPHAYGLLCGEAGVHRLQRTSPFDSRGRRHTSFASVQVDPLLETNDEIAIRESDLVVQTFRGSGKGGQHRNKVETAVRITHVPSGITVSCQAERSQHQNYMRALSLLRSALRRREDERTRAESARRHQSLPENGWGHHRRTIVLTPSTRVIDHLSGWESSDAEAVLNGHLRPLLRASLFSRSTMRICPTS